MMAERVVKNDGVGVVEISQIRATQGTFLFGLISFDKVYESDLYRSYLEWIG